jgi:cold shock CspA family protein
MLQDEKQGAIKRVLYDKHFGFISGDDGSEYFFHVHEVSSGRSVFDRLVMGDRVKFFKAPEQREGADGTTKAFAAVRIRAL